MTEERITIETPDGPMAAYVARPADDGPFPALVVVQEAFGVNHHIRDVCGRFAAEGYVALAPEIFHRAGRGIEIPYETVPPAMAQLALLTNEGLEMDLARAFDHLRTSADVRPDQVGLIGYCIGGYAAFLGACRLDPAATVSFYGGGIVRERPNFKIRPILDQAGDIDAPILCVFGGEDKGITPQDVEALQQKLDTLAVPHEVVVYPGAGHAFFCDARAAYHAESARDAWRKTLDWLERWVRGRVTA